MQAHIGGWLSERRCVRSVSGWQICPELIGLCKETLVDKTVVASSKLGRMLKDNDGSDKIQSIRLVGVCTDICVFFNAMLPEVEIIVDASCCAGIIPERHAKALFVMKLCGIKVENECKRLTECPWQNEVYL